MKHAKYSLGRSKEPLPKKLLLVIAAVVLIVAAAGTYAIIRSGDNQDPTKQQAENTSQDDTENSDDSSKNDSNTSVEAEKHITTQYAGDSANSNSKLTGILNYKAVTDNNLVLRVTIDQTISSGTCALTLTDSSGGRVVTRSAGIIQNPSSSTCEGFNVPVSELGSGTWKIEVGVNGDNKTGAITGEVTI